MKNLLVADPSSPFIGKKVDVEFVAGKISGIGQKLLSQEGFHVIDFEGAALTPSWVDVFADFADPGEEHREDLLTGSTASKQGGMGHVFLVPNTTPAISNKSLVSYILKQADFLPIRLHPFGALSKNIAGKELTEVYDMKEHGAVAFSDGFVPLQDSQLMLKAMQYVSAVNGVVVQMPHEGSIAKNAQINEGVISVELGLQGIPTLTETLPLARDIALAKYTGCKIHFTGVSTKEGLAMIAKAKSEGYPVTCSVTPHHLCFCDADIVDYDTNFKVKPPLRSKDDMLALRNGILNGTIDCIASHHHPWHGDVKDIEFEAAAFGSASGQVCFQALNHALPELAWDSICRVLSTNARTIFGLPAANLEVGAVPDFTIFSKDGTTLLNDSNNKSKSRNSMFWNFPLKGQVLGIANGKGLFLNNGTEVLN